MCNLFGISLSTENTTLSLKRIQNQLNIVIYFCVCVCVCVHAHVYAHIHLYVCGWTLISGFWGLEKKSHEKKSTDHTLLKVLCFSHQDWVSPQIGLCCCLVLSAVTGKEEVEIILEECRLHFPIFEYAS